MAEKTKEQRVKTELRRFKKMTEGLDPSRKYLAENLAERIAFMTVNLEDLEKRINEEGVEETYQNGRNQSGTKATGNSSAYMAMVKAHAYNLARFREMLPQAAPGGALLKLLQDDD